MPKRFIQVGTGGFGRYWCRRIIPSIADVAVPVAAVDVNAEALQNAEFAGIPEEYRYTDIREALKKHKADFIVLVIPPQFREAYIDLANLVNYDTGDDAPCWVQERVHLHPTCVLGKCYTLFADGEENQRL